jgi:hypothetical protein
MVLRVLSGDGDGSSVTAFCHRCRVLRKYSALGARELL